MLKSLEINKLPVSEKATVKPLRDKRQLMQMQKIAFLTCIQMITLFFLNLLLRGVF